MSFFLCALSWPQCVLQCQAVSPGWGGAGAGSACLRAPPVPLPESVISLQGLFSTPLLSYSSFFQDVINPLVFSFRLFQTSPWFFSLLLKFPHLPSFSLHSWPAQSALLLFCSFSASLPVCFLLLLPQPSLAKSIV